MVLALAGIMPLLYLKSIKIKYIGCQLAGFTNYTYHQIENT